ncbi:Ethanolamine utilisation protein EutQ [Bacillus sp. OV166]|nr:Ethanolamine utilisation protein EutQ [Bacillus sp. OV166]
MSEKTVTKTDYNFLSQKPGIQLIKAGTYEKKELNAVLGNPALKSQIIDVPVTDRENAVSLGYYSMQKATDSFDFMYEFLEIKVIVRGKIVVSDQQGNKYVGEVGDVFIFNPGTLVTFEGESDGDAIYTAHRLPEPLFM